MEFRKNLKVLSEEFQTIITNAAKKHVGKAKPGKGKVSWVTQQSVSHQVKEQCIQQQKGISWCLPRGGNGY